MSVLLLGRGDDPVLAYLHRRAEALGTPCGFVDAARVAAEGSWDLELPGGGGELRCGAEVWDLSACTAVVTRPPGPGPMPGRWAAFVDSVGPWLRACPLAVVNPPPPRGSAPAAALARMALAAAGLPAADWRWARGVESGPRAPGDADRAAARVYVVGEAVLPSHGGPCAGRLPGAGQLPAPAVQRALVGATARLGWLLARWDAAVDGDGVWQWLGADPAPDFRQDDRLLGGAVSRRILALRSRPAAAIPLARPDAGPRTAGPAPRRGRCRTGLDPCPCGSPSSIRAFDGLLAKAGSVLDRDLPAPERWGGPMRRESLRYGTAEERSRYEEAFNRLAGDAAGRAFDPLTVDGLQALHRRAGGDGALRTVHLWIPGGHTFPHPAAVLQLLQELCAAYEEAPPWAARAPRAGYSSALQLHLGLLTVHPFRDGNGRLSRLVAARELMRRGFRSRVLTIVDQHYEPWPSVYTALLVAVEEGRICQAACVLGMQLAALAGAWRAAPSLARAQWRAVEPRLRGVAAGESAVLLGPVAEGLSAARDR